VREVLAVILFSESILISAVLIFILRLIDVSLGTIRMIMTVRGRRAWATMIGFVEISIWIIAVSQVISNLDSIWKILAYSSGFATGTLVGMWLEDRLALGDVSVYVISRENGSEIAHHVRKAHYGATELPAHGHTGPVTMVGIVTPRKRLHELLHLVNIIDAGAFVTVDDKRQVLRGYGRVAK
jgi:uncharacterized protein YebE (UPF0316 family)